MIVRPSSFPCQPQHIHTNTASEIVLVKCMGISGNEEYIYIEVAERKMHLFGVRRNEDTRKTDRGSHLAGFKRRREG